MKVENENGAVTEAIGYIDIGTVVIPRIQLAPILPDFKRFERCLPLALKASAYTKHQGAIPPWLEQTQMDDIVATVREIGSPELNALNELETIKNAGPT